jgi:nitroreductase
MSPLITEESTATVGFLARLVGLRQGPDPHGEPPDPQQLAWLLRAAASVPDHGGLQPWRFVVASGEGRSQFADALESDFFGSRGQSPRAVLDKVRRKAFAAPTFISIIASPVLESKVPVWEQNCSASCCGYAMVLAAHSLGLGAVWKSTPVGDGPSIQKLFAMRPSESLLGWVNVGTLAEPPAGLRPTPDLSVLATEIGPGGLAPYLPPE